MNEDVKAGAPDSDRSKRDDYNTTCSAFGGLMTALDVDEARPMRRVRPWIAALLTFLGWGLGFYYAKRTRAAVLLAAAGIVAPLALVIAVLILAENDLFAVPGPLRLLPLAATALVAVWAWRVAARNQSVEQGAPSRLLGYLALWLVPVIIALTIRFTVVQPFRMPSGSMEPTLHVGEYFVATKWSYGYSRFSFAPFQDLLPDGRIFAREPRRGDLVVFRPVPEPDRDFIKRLVGMPGDRIQMIGGVLHINGQAVMQESLGVIDFTNSDGMPERVQAYRETLPDGVSYTTFDRIPDSELDNTREYVVPEGHYFMLGDDRDNSADSRVPSVIGYVPFDALVGRVGLIIGVPDRNRPASTH